MLRKKIKIEPNVCSIKSVSEQTASDRPYTDSPPSPVICYSRGLKAMVDVLPDNTDAFSTQTIDNYLWVIEQLLMNIYSLYDDVSEEDPAKTIANLSRYAQEMSVAEVYKFPSNQLEY